MNQRSVLAVIAIALVLGLGIVLIKNAPGDSGAPSSGIPSTVTPTKTDNPMMKVDVSSTATDGAMKKEEGMMESKIKTFTIEGSNYKFKPAEMRVKKGDKVKIIFKNVEGIHDLTIGEFNVATKQIKDGSEESMEFTADKTGTFEFYCSVGKHRELGMKGSLIVE